MAVWSFTPFLSHSMLWLSYILDDPSWSWPQGDPLLKHVCATKHLWRLCCSLSIETQSDRNKKGLCERDVGGCLPCPEDVRFHHRELELWRQVLWFGAGYTIYTLSWFCLPPFTLSVKSYSKQWHSQSLFVQTALNSVWCLTCAKQFLSK